MLPSRKDSMLGRGRNPAAAGRRWSPARQSLRSKECPGACDGARTVAAAPNSDHNKCTEPVAPSSGTPGRPPPERLPLGSSINLRRSVLGARGNLARQLPAVNHSSRRFSANCTEIISDAFLTRRRPPTWAPDAGPQRNAPSRRPLRPALRLTSAEAGACRSSINLRCSLLGAIGRLGHRRGHVNTL